MSGFATLNGVNAARNTGLTAGKRVQPQQYTVQPQAPVTTAVLPGVGGTGMMGTGVRPGGGMLGTNYNHVDPNIQAQFDAQARANDHGVRPAQPPQPQYAAPAAPQFDPNDPRNAALAGYMNGT